MKLLYSDTNLNKNNNPKMASIFEIIYYCELFSEWGLWGLCGAIAKELFWGL